MPGNDRERCLPPGDVAGELILHPLAIFAVALLLLNDHLFKQLWPGLITGKVSDVAGLAFFPLLLQSLWEHGKRMLGVFVSHSQKEIIALTALTAIAFILVKTWLPANEGYKIAWASLQWPALAIRAAVMGHHIPGLRMVSLVRDITDLATLPVLLVPLHIGRHRP